MRFPIGTPRCLLVVAPHPDDEAIGAHALISRLRRRGVEVRILVVTDGHASHRGSVRWPRSRLVSERQRETRRAMRGIGVPTGQVGFLGLPDGALSTVVARAHRLIGREVRRAPAPLLLLAPAVGDDHPDHRVTAAAVVAVRRAGVRHLAYPVWPAGNTFRAILSVSLTTQERLAKRRTIKSYRTQAGRITDDPDGFALTRTQIAAFSGPVETFAEYRR